MGLRMGGSAGGTRRERKRLFIYGGGLLGLVVLWTAAVFILGIGSGAGGEGGAASGAQEEATSGSRQEPGVVEDTVFEAGGGEKDYVTPEHPERFMEQERERDRRAQGEPRLHEGGATGEPASYDPLGLQEERVPLTPADRRRAESTAARFVAAAFGYTGTDRDAYLDELNALLAPEEFYASPGSQEVERYSEQVEASGTSSAARMSAFEIEDVRGQRVTGYAYFKTADTYNRYGGIQGDEKSYRQRLTLTRSGAVFEVSSADEIQEVRRR